MRPGLHWPGTEGEFRIELHDSNGSLLYRGFRDIDGEGGHFPNLDPEVGTYPFQATVPEEVLGTPLTLRVFRDDEFTTQTTFNGAAPTLSFEPTTVECNRMGGADFSLDASSSSDPDGDTLHFFWNSADIDLESEGAIVTVSANGMGPKVVTLSAADGFHTVELTQDVVIQDTMPPEIILVDNPPMPLCSLTGELVRVVEPEVVDICSEVILQGRVVASTNPTLQLPMALDDGAAILPVGSHTVEWTATDASGNASTAHQTIDLIPALLATNHLELRDQSRFTTPGGFSGAASVGSARSWIGVEAAMADLWSVPDVELRDRAAVHGDVRTAGSLIQGSDVVISGVTVEQLPPLPSAPVITVSFPVPSNGNVHLEPHTSQSVEVGSFGTVHVKTGATLVLSAPGEYYVQQLILEPQATIQATGSASLFIATQIIDRGTFLGFEESSIFYMGTAPFFLEAPIVSRVLAPQGALVIRGNMRTGQVLARELSVDAGWTVQCDSSL